MIKEHKTAIFVGILLLVIMLITSLNLYFLLENINTRDARVRNSVEQILNSIDREESQQPLITMIKPVKGVDYFDGKDGVSVKGDKGDTGLSGKDGISIKGDAGANGMNGQDGLTLEVRCNKSKNRWESKYTGDLTWQVMNGEVIKCTVDTNEGDTHGN